MRSLKGMVGIVSGTVQSGEIGAAIASLLRERGATIVTADADDGDVQVDITDAAEITSCVSEVVARLGRLDILVNSACASIESSAFLEQTGTDFDKAFDINVRGMMLFSQAAIPHMRSCGGGCIVNIASISGHKATSSVPPVAIASRFAAVGMSKAMAQEFGPDNIRCNAVCPGLVRTPTQDAALVELAESEGVDWSDIVDAQHATIPLGRSGEPAEIAALVAYLCSAAGAYISGAAIPADGGMGL